MKPFTPNDIGWVAVMTKPNAELAADTEIRRACNLWTFFPFNRETKRRERRGPQGKTIVQVFEDTVPVFSRYIFARIGDDRDIYAVNACRNVQCIVKQPGAERPLRIPPAVMNHWMEKTDANGFAGRIDLTARKPFTNGDRIIVDDGSPFSGFFMQVVADTGDEIEAWLNILGAERKVKLDPRYVKAA